VESAAPAPAPEGTKAAISESISKHKAAKDVAAPVKTNAIEEAAAKAAASEINQPAAVAAAYTPSLKFKFMGQEKDIPELFHSIIKDAETEKAVRELHEQAMWFNETKPRFIEQSKELSSLTKGLDTIGEYLNNGNLDKFFGTFGLTDQAIFEYVKNKLEYEQLPPEEQKRIDEQNKLREDAYNLQRENAILKETQLEAATQQRGNELISLLNSPQISTIANSHPGGMQGFYKDVVSHAWYTEQVEGVDMTPQQAIASYIQARGLGANQVAQATQPATLMPSSQPAAQQQVAQRAPTLPTVPSQGTSPAKKMVTSIKDIQSARAKLEAQLGG
jgi:hypothetical protein